MIVFLCGSRAFLEGWPYRGAYLYFEPGPRSRPRSTEGSVSMYMFKRFPPSAGSWICSARVVASSVHAAWSRHWCVHELLPPLPWAEDTWAPQVVGIPCRFPGKSSVCALMYGGDGEGKKNQVEKHHRQGRAEKAASSLERWNRTEGALP